jgi:V/A-type H+-transporting ATPase subunit E
MNGIDKIVERILETADLDREKILADADTEARDICGSLKDLADAEALEAVGRGKEQARKRIERSAGSSELETRRMILESKQKMVDMAFIRAKGLLLQLPDDEYASFLAKLAGQALLTGKEEIILGQTDVDRYGSRIIAKVNKLAAEKGLPAAVTVSSGSGSFEGGLVVRMGNVETNCTFDTLLRMLRDSMAGDVAGILFGRGG